MPGRPPDPDDVVRFSIETLVREQLYAFGFSLLVPQVAAGGLLYMDGLGSSFVLEVGPALTQIQEVDAALATCRMSVQEPVSIRYASRFPSVHGRGPNGTAGTTCAGIYLPTALGRRGSGSRLRIPGIADDLIEGPTTLSASGRSYLVALCTAMVNWVRSITGPTGSPCTLGTVSKQSSGAWLPAAAFSPALGVVPSDRLEVLSRRRSKRGRVSST